MINYNFFSEQLKKNKLQSNVYIFCSMDQLTVDKAIKMLKDKYLEPSTESLNYAKYDLKEVETIRIMEDAKVVPFMSNKRFIEVYNSNELFMPDETEGCKVIQKNFKKVIEDYLKDPEQSTIMIYSYIYSNKRESFKKNKLLALFDNNSLCTVVIPNKENVADKMKRIQAMFSKEGKKINSSILLKFTERMPSNNDFIYNEVKKLCAYNTEDEIIEENLSITIKSDTDDVFDLTDYIIKRKLNEALSLVNNLIFNGQNEVGINALILSQFRRMHKVKTEIEYNKKSCKDIAAEMKMHSSYPIEIAARQSKQYTFNQLEQAIEYCLESDAKLKGASSGYMYMEIEKLIIKLVRI